MRLFLLAIACFASPLLFAFDHDHSVFNTLLAKQVNPRGLVNYAAIQKEPAELDAYLAELAVVTKAEINGWTREQKLAYWINAYNAYTLKAIVDHYPIKASGVSALRFPKNSIRQIDGVWDKLTWKAGGGMITLNDMEHNKLRAELKEPRIHFAIVCASIGCPVLRNEAFTAANVEAQLEEAARAFVLNPAKVNLTSKALQLSKIFEWFGEDFQRFDAIDGYGKQDGSVSFCLKYLPEKSAGFLKNRKPGIKWLDYDWTLNEQP